MKRSFLALFLNILTLGMINGQSDTTIYPEIGDIAPTFICKTLDGDIIDITKLKGKIIMINFFATWCGPCNKELPVLQKNIWNKYKNNPDFVLIILGREHNEQEIRDFVEIKKFKMPFAPDPKREIFKLYASQNIPRNVVIGRDGKIIYQSIGFTSEEFKKLENLLAENIKQIL